MFGEMLEADFYCFLNSAATYNIVWYWQKFALTNLKKSVLTNCRTQKIKFVF